MRRRCFQRTSIHALAHQTDEGHAAASWLPLRGNAGSLLLRYVVSRPSRRSTALAKLLHEHRLHGDVLLSNYTERPATCFAKLVEALALFAFGPVLGHAADYVAIGDDDAWFHVPRLVQDLAPLVALHEQRRGILYGWVNFNAGWQRDLSREFGWGVYNVDAYRLWRAWRWRVTHGKRRQAHQYDGPFPNAFGFGVVMSVDLASHIATSANVSQYVSALAAARARPSLPPGLRHRPKMCDPPTDSSLGWVLTHLDPIANVTVIDNTYGGRYLHAAGYVNASSLQLGEQLATRTAVAHRIVEWRQHREALCTSTAPPLARGQSDRASIVRCRGAHAPLGGCGQMGCRGPRDLIYPRSGCEAQPSCAHYYSSTFRDWTFCIHVGFRRVPRIAQPVKSPWPICSADAAQVLRACGVDETADLINE